MTEPGAPKASIEASNTSDTGSHSHSSKSSDKSRAGLWLAFAVVAVMFVADWFYGSFTRALILGQASIAVTTEPAGARVLADTIELGTTPLDAGKVLPGTYVVRVEHPHYEPVRETLTLARGDEVRRELQLVRGTGALELVSNPRGASVRLNGELQDEKTPATFAGIAAGIYEVELFLPGRKTAVQSVDVQRKQTAEFSADLNRLPTGTLSIDLIPANSRVELVGTELTYTPGMPLPLADYTVRVSSPGHAAETQQLSLRRGPNRLRFELQRQFGELAVAVTPAAAQVEVISAGKSQRYSAPLRLPVGKVQVRASQSGFRSKSQALELTAEGARVTLNLPRFDVEAGRVIRDALRSGGQAPEVVVIAAGTFEMGDRTGDGAADERPVHAVQLRVPFAIGVSEVTRGEWNLQFGGGDDKELQLPKTGVSREAIDQYLGWLSAQTGNRYRLPSEAEWEFAARAGSESRFGVSDTPAELCRYGNIADATLKTTYSSTETLDCDDTFVRLAPVRSFAPNALGLYDTLGNASEWVADCWHGSYTNAPANGSAWGTKCSTWVIRGGAWDSGASSLRVSFRSPGGREKGSLGFRVVRDL